MEEEWKKEKGRDGMDSEKYAQKYAQKYLEEYPIKYPVTRISRGALRALRDRILHEKVALSATRITSFGLHALRDHCGLWKSYSCWRGIRYSHLLADFLFPPTRFQKIFHIKSS